LLLDDAQEAVEGLIVDTNTGGIGFWNHTVPFTLKFGSVWSEDISFILLETECVDTNLTEFSIPSDRLYGGVADIALTDRGGFANFT